MDVLLNIVGNPKNSITRSRVYADEPASTQLSTSHGILTINADACDTELG